MLARKVQLKDAQGLIIKWCKEKYKKRTYSSRKYLQNITIQKNDTDIKPLQRVLANGFLVWVHLSKLLRFFLGIIHLTYFQKEKVGERTPYLLVKDSHLLKYFSWFDKNKLNLLQVMNWPVFSKPWVFSPLTWTNTGL